MVSPKLCVRKRAHGLGGDHRLNPAVNLPAWQPFRRKAASCTVKTRWDLVKTRWDFVKTRWDLDKTRRDFVKTRWDLDKTRWDLGGTRWDLVKTRWDFVKTRWDLDKTRWDLGGTRWDLVKTRWDFDKTRRDLDKTRWDLGGTRWDLNSSYPIHHVVPKASRNHKTFQHKRLAEVGTSMLYQCEKPGACSCGVYAGGTQTMLGTEGGVIAFDCLFASLNST